MVKVLRHVFDKGIFLNEKSIEERKQKHHLAVDPIGFFLNTVVSIESVGTDKISKDDFYEAYKLFCKNYRLAVESKISFGKIIKGNGYAEYREHSGENRRTMWKGIKLVEEYSIDLGQQQLG